MTQDHKEMPRDYSRFEKFIEISLAGCWLWTGSKNKQGYGQFRDSEKKFFRAHRYSYHIHNGEIPNGMVICHTCDNPSCVNPVHLVAATQKENIADMINKGRKAISPFGEISKRSKLTDAKVINILESYDVPDLVLAHRHNVAPQTISGIRLGYHWKHIDRSGFKEPLKFNKHSAKKARESLEGKDG